jgi:hypothetical protein
MSADAPNSRRIRSGQFLALADLLQSIFVTELIRPSNPLFISSPWISDLDLIDNSARQFAALAAAWPARSIRLSEILTTILERGGSVIVITGRSESNQSFLGVAREIESAHPRRFRVIIADDVHEKGICGDDFSLDGSMNLTYNGVRVNKEYVIFTTIPREVAERRMEFLHAWGTQD